MKIPGHNTPVTNLSYCVRRNAYNPVRYHSGTVIPGGTVGWNLNPKSTGNTPPVSPAQGISGGNSTRGNSPEAIDSGGGGGGANSGGSNGSPSGAGGNGGCGVT